MKPKTPAFNEVAGDQVKAALLLMLHASRRVELSQKNPRFGAFLAEKRPIMVQQSRPAWAENKKNADLLFL